VQEAFLQKEVCVFAGMKWERVHKRLDLSLRKEPYSNRALLQGAYLQDGVCLFAGRRLNGASHAGGNER